MEKVEYNRTGDIQAEGEWIPTMCHGCTKGPDLIKVCRINGVATNVKGNFEGPMSAITKGKLCPKPFGLLQKLYNPYRIRAPLKRTNPLKGPGIDPKWVEISWDEALNIVAEKLKEIRRRDSRLLAATGSAPFQITMYGTWLQFLKAFGPYQSFKSGHSIRCGLGQHSLSNCIHGAFRTWPDFEYCNYLLLLGSNIAASGGVMSSMLYQKAVKRGMKVVVVDPVLSFTAAKADEWLPIRPDTDGAFLLALIHVIINELGRYDREFLKEMTNSPYLVGPDGFFVRDQTTGKVFVWDSSDGRSKTYDNPTIKDVALEGRYTIQGIQSRPSFQILKEHISQYTPEWASAITDIPAHTIRRVAGEFVDAALIGASINIEGVVLPYRPAAVQIGRPVEASRHSFINILAQHILAMLMGSIEVPGGLGGGSTYPTRTNFGILPGSDGMVKLDIRPLTWPPVSYDGKEALLPLSSWDLGHPSHLGYLNLTNPLPNFPLPSVPEVYLRWRDNPLTSLGDPDIILRALKRVPIIVSIAYVHDEVSEISDVVLPDHMELERFDVYSTGWNCGTTKKFQGIILRQPVVEPVGKTMDIADICTELADRAGFLAEYNGETNKAFGLSGSYRLEPHAKYAWVDIVDRRCRSATKGARGLEDFKKSNALVEGTAPALEYEVHSYVKAMKLRYPLPYMEQVKRVGMELTERLNKVGIDWWPTQEYTPLPTYSPSVLDKVSPEYDLYATTNRIAQLSYGSDVDIPVVVEATQQMFGETDVLMHTQAAQDRGFKEGEEVWIESEIGKIKCKVKVGMGIRPDTILIAGQLGQKSSPIAKGTGWVSLNSLVPIRIDWTDPVLGTMQGNVIKVKIYKARGRRHD